MTLSQQLNEFSENVKQNIPAEKFDIMLAATAALEKSGIELKIPKVGTKFPNFELPNHLNEMTELSDLLKNGPVVVSFYRGSWCPYCNLELVELQKTLTEFESNGAQLVAISPETADHSSSTIKKHHLDFQVLTDEDNKFSKKVGLVFEMPTELQTLYPELGIDVADHNGNQNFELPLAATFVVATDGTIKYVFAKADYTKRAEPTDVLAALNS